MVEKMASSGELPGVVFFCLMAAFGGTAAGYGLRACIVVGTALILCLIFIQREGENLAKMPFILLFLLTAILLLPLFQSIPLPITADGSGARSVASDIRTLLGQTHALQPISLDPASSRFSALLLFVPIAALMAGFSASSRLQSRIIVLIALIAIPMMLIGAAQWASKGTLFDFYNSKHKMLAIGTFANRNHMAFFLCLAFAATMVTIDRLSTEPARWLLAGIAFLIGVMGVIATGSRSGLVLYVLTAVASLFMLIRPTLTGRRWFTAMAGIFVLWCAIAYPLLWINTVGQASAARFHALNSDERWQIWRSSAQLAQENLPWGSGLGTFVPVYIQNETVEHVGPWLINHAHNDYLELTIEGGLPAGALIIIAMSTIAYWSCRILSAKRVDTAPATIFAIIGVAVLSAASLWDYPLRTPFLAALFGFCVGIIAQNSISAKQETHIFHA